MYKVEVCNAAPPVGNNESSVNRSTVPAANSPHNIKRAPLVDLAVVEDIIINEVLSIQGLANSGSFGGTA